MPFAAKQEQEDQQGQAQQGQNVSGVSTTINLPGQTAQARGTQQKSGQYQNIEKYLSANAPQAEQMGQKIAGNVEQKVGSAQQATGALAGQVQKVADYDPSKVLAAPTTEAKQQYQQVKSTGGYTGPSDIVGLSGYSDAKKAQNAALGDVKQVSTEVGQQDLLRQAYARPNYTGGANILDQSLLQRSQGGRQVVEGLAQKYSGLAGQFGTTEQQAASDIAAQKAKAAQIKGTFAPAEQAARTGILSPIEQRVADANAQSKVFQNQVSDISDLNLRADTAATLGLAPGKTIFDLDLSSYVNPEAQAANVQNIASADERTKYNQLMDFLGTNTGDLGLGDPTYKAGGFDTAKLQSDLAKKDADYQAAFTGTNYGQFGGKTPAMMQLALDRGDFEPGDSRIEDYTNALNEFYNSFKRNRVIGSEA